MFQAACAATLGSAGLGFPRCPLLGWAALWDSLPWPKLHRSLFPWMERGTGVGSVWRRAPALSSEGHFHPVHAGLHPHWVKLSSCLTLFLSSHGKQVVATDQIFCSGLMMKSVCSSDTFYNTKKLSKSIAFHLAFAPNMQNFNQYVDKIIFYKMHS